MPRVGKTIYQTARFNTGLIGEKVAELLNISIESIRDYERGATLPPPEIVLKMAEIYRAPWLGYEYLRMTNPIGQSLLPELLYRDIPASLLDLQVELDHAFDYQKKMAEVGRDDHIDEQEKPVWIKGLEEIHHLVRAAFSVILAPIEKEKAACVGAQTAFKTQKIYR
jgi:transcriptional regulator with XRE-family HTH domain